MTARLGRFCARCAAVRARATVEGDASPLAERPPPSTTATSGNPARSPSLSPVARGSDLMERAVHDHESRERVRAPRVLVNGIAIRLPASDALLVVAGVDIGQLLASDRAPRHDLDAEGVERLLRVVRCARPVCEVAWRVHLELELLPILGVDTV